MKKKLFIKLFTGSLAAILVLGSLTLFITFRVIRDHYRSSLAENLTALAQALSPEVLGMVRSGSTAELNALITRLDRDIHRRMTVIRSDGKVIADSENQADTLQNHHNRPEFLEALKGNTGVSLRYSGTMKEDMLYVAVPLAQDGRIIGAMRVSMFVRQINALLADLQRLILTAMLVIIGISLVAVSFYVWDLSRAISTLVVAAQRVADGDYSTKVLSRRNDELKELADSFNRMTEQLQQAFSQVTHKTDELNTIVTSLKEGLFLIDTEGRIRMANPGFAAFFGDNHQDRFYWEVLRSSPFEQLVTRLRGDRKSLTDEIELDGRHFLCSLSLVPHKGDIVVLLHDITQVKNLEKMKKDLVANVSHELRTPLTAIKGFVETLADEASEENRHYLAVIHRHTDRLINIVQDLLVLSALEDKGSSLVIEDVRLREMLDNIARVLGPRCVEKGLSFTVAVDPQLSPFPADSFKLEQALVNLIDNAIKYTEKGTITVSAERAGGNMLIRVSDTGIGIPAEHLSRIFERFYVVDKSRSRKLGGTGLGLSIVKHIVLLHSGTVTVDSTIGRGTTFTLSLPAVQ